VRWRWAVEGDLIVNVFEQLVGRARGEAASDRLLEDRDLLPAS
jgi:hypothetical protein